MPKQNKTMEMKNYSYFVLTNTCTTMFGVFSLVVATGILVIISEWVSTRLFLSSDMQQTV